MPKLNVVIKSGDCESKKRRRRQQEWWLWKNLLFLVFNQFYQSCIFLLHGVCVCVPNWAVKSCFWLFNLSIHVPKEDVKTRKVCICDELWCYVCKIKGWRLDKHWTECSKINIWSKRINVMSCGEIVLWFGEARIGLRGPTLPIEHTLPSMGAEQWVHLWTYLNISFCSGSEYFTKANSTNCDLQEFQI